VLDIDLNSKQVNGIFHNAIPRNAEDFTGDIPLRERAELISGADFFIGLGSGLSWLAWCCNVPVVLISGFSMPFSEFFTPYRVINYNVCHGCYSDTRYKLNPQEYDWCPKHKGTSRHFECTRGITPEMVIEKIKQIPEFYNRTKGEKQK
jgi:autotransporter strand-loop-strand O-heptosyltransferase